MSEKKGMVKRLNYIEVRKLTHYKKFLHETHVYTRKTRKYVSLVIEEMNEQVLIG